MTGLHDDTTVVRLAASPAPEIDKYDRIIIGGSIHLGGIQKEIRAFCDNHLKELLARKVGLFLCCMYEGDVARNQFEEAYPEALRKHAATIGLFGGELTLGKMNMIEKMIVKKVAKVTADVSSLKPGAIREFAQEFSRG